MVTELLSERIIRYIDQAAELYYRLILVVAPAGGGKTQALLDVVKQCRFRYINVNLELSRRLLDLSERQRALQIPRLLADIISKEVPSQSSNQNERNHHFI